MALNLFVAALVIFPIILSTVLLQPWTLTFSLTGIHCAILGAVLGDKVLTPTDPRYEASRQVYWSQQQQSLTPVCIVRPQGAKDVSLAVRVISFLASLTTVVGWKPCQIAVKGGGHTPWPGSSNVDGGITLDMGAMNDVSLSGMKSIASVGAGAKWIDVYETLDPLSVSVVGGRVADVGVAGLLLGGGLSFFSPRFGWAGDNVENIEIVLANGQIVNVNVTSNADLWSALKGGSNNFGIVTRFDLRAFPQNSMWGGTVVNPIESRFQVFQAFVDLNAISEYDEFASVICNLAYHSSRKEWVIVNNLVYTKPEPYPRALEPFTQVQPILSDGLRYTNMSDLTGEINRSSTHGLRYMFMTATYGNDVDLLSKIFDITNATTSSINTVPGMLIAVTFQPIPSSITSKVTKAAPNVLGLDHQDGPQVLALLNLFWNDAADDRTMNDAGQQWLKRSDEEASKRNLKRRWIYLNYAHSSQKPIESYGAENKRKLQMVSRKYDPDGLFQRSVVGGFKLFL